MLSVKRLCTEVGLLFIVMSDEKKQNKTMSVLQSTQKDSVCVFVLFLVLLIC